MADSLLIIEDETLLAEELARHFRRQGWEVELADTLERARHKLLEEDYDPLVTLADMTLPDGDSLDLFEALQQRGQTGEWILLTGYGGVPESVRALRLGAYDFLEKPCSVERLGAILGGARRSARAQRQLQDQREAGSRRYLSRGLRRHERGRRAATPTPVPSGGGALQRPDHQRRDRHRQGAGGAHPPPLGPAREWSR